MTRAVAAACCVALLGAGCTQDRGDAIAERPSPAVTPTEPVAPPTPTVPPVFEPEDEVLTVAIQEPSTLDPMRLQDPGGVLIARQLYEGLTRWDPIEEEVLPAAAESWKVDEGGRRFTFKLRQGMTFHDGTPVRSKDFAFAFDRITRKSSASDIAYALEDVQGFAEVNQLAEARHLSGVRTPNPTTLVINLSEPFYDFPKLLTHPSLVPLPERAVARQDRFLTTPVGNGPFHIAQAWAPGDPVLLKAFVGFYETPELDGIRFQTFADAAASWLPFTNGDIDVAEVPAGEIEAAQEAYGDKGFVPFLATYSFGFNVRSDQLDDIRIRRAINKAIDRETIVQTVYRGSMQVPRGIVPVGMPGFQENICVGLCEFDPAGAKRIVSKLKRKDRSLTLEFSGDQPHPRVVRMVRRDLQAAGFRVKVRAFPFPKYLKRLRSGEHSMFRLGWIAEYPTPDAYLRPLFRSESSDNHSGIESAKVDRLLRRARATKSEGKRVQLYIEAEKAVLDVVPIAPVGSFVTHWAAQPEVVGLVLDQMGGFDAVNVELASD
ncbi:MAG TPA: ABC transporter substrate-binding protein [Actinomycetota bacterium]|nr:ABC transporter substrate-binding protein [Actinomycetota bacterium]